MTATFISAANVPASGDSQASSRAVTKPAGAQVGVFFVSFWNFSGTITPPAGMVLRSNVVNGTERTAIYLKYVNGDATGTNYNFAFSNSWSALKAHFWADVDPGLDLAAVPFDTAVANSNNYPSVSVTTVEGAALSWHGNSFDYGSSGAQTPPASFTERGDTFGSGSATRVSPGAGSQSATGATYGSSTQLQSVLIALAPADTGGGSNDGTVSATLPGGMSANVAGNVRNSATTSASLPGPVAGNISANARASGSVDSILPALSAVLDGAGHVAGAVDVQLGAIGITLAGESRAEGDVASQLPSLVASVTGEVSVQATLSGHLPVITLEIDAIAKSSGDVDLQLPVIGSVITGAVRDEATLSASLPAITLQMIGDSETSDNALDIELPMIGMDVDGEVSQPATLDIDLPAITAVLSAGATSTGDLLANLPSITALLTGNVIAENLGVISAALSRLAVSIEAEVEGNGPYQAVEDPASSLQPNPATATVRNKTTVNVRPNTAEARPI